MIRYVAEKILQRELTAEDGIALPLIEEAEARLGVRLPYALREFYRVAGNIDIFASGHNCFAPLHEIYRDEGKLFFLEENQSACLWAVDTSALDYDNPAVYQVTETEDGENAVWPEEIPLPEFLRLMLYFQVCMGESTEAEDSYDYLGVCDGLSEELIDFLSSWEKVVDYNNFTVYYSPGVLIWYMTGEDELIYLCTQNEEDYSVISGQFGFDEL